MKDSKQKNISSEMKADSQIKYSIPSRIARISVGVLMCAALVITGLSTALTSFDFIRKDDLVIVLDPGHGGADTGAVNTELGLYESAINLKIALACRDRLMQYNGVRVYMTHTGVGNTYGKSSLSSRVSVAGEVKADIFISLHINSADNKSANGAEIYVPATTHEPKYNEQCTRLAENFIANFTALGLNSRGIKTRKSGGGRVYHFSDGTTETGDYYYVVGEPISRLQIPGILVEHAFIGADSDFLDSDADLEALGQADAEAIAKHYGLRRKEEYAGSSNDTSSVSSHVSSIEEHVSSEPDTSSEEGYTSEEDANSELKTLEDMIRALPDSPTESDANQIRAVRTAYYSLSENSRGQLDATLYQRMCNIVTAYENTVKQVRISVREGSQLSIDRFNGILLNAETTAQPSGRITVFTITVELALYINPNAPEQYQHEGFMTYRVTSPDGRLLDQTDDVPDGSVISVMYNDTVLDSLIISIN